MDVQGHSFYKINGGEGILFFHLFILFLNNLFVEAGS